MRAGNGLGLEKRREGVKGQEMEMSTMAGNKGQESNKVCTKFGSQLLHLPPSLPPSLPSYHLDMRQVHIKPMERRPSLPPSLPPSLLTTWTCGKCILKP